MGYKMLKHMEEMIEELGNYREELENMAYFFDLPNDYDMKLLKIRDSIEELMEEACQRYEYEINHADLNALEETVR